MPHTNVNDTEFSNDGISSADYKRDVNGFTQDDRDLMRDALGAGPVIAEGGFVENGTNLNTFKISVTRARDNQLRPVYLTAESDNNAAEKINGDWNYIAIKYKQESGEARPAYDTQNSYDVEVTDGFEVDVSDAEQNEDDGYIRLCKAKLNGTWEYEFSYRSRDIALMTSGMLITIPGVTLSSTPWYPPECDEMSTLFDWAGRIIKVEVADKQDKESDAYPVDLNNIITVTTSWQTLGTIKDDSDVAVTLDLKADALFKHRLYFRISGLGGNTTVRGAIMLLGGVYNAEVM